MKHQGFTLIELLVVIIIISIVTSAVLLKIGRNRHKDIEYTAKNLYEALQLAEDEALLDPAVIACAFDDLGYRFYQYVGGKADDPWRLIQGSGLMPKQRSPDMAIKLVLSNQKKQETVQKIIFSPNGDITPFTLWIGEKHQDPLYKIVGREDGLMTLEPL